MNKLVFIMMLLSTTLHSQKFNEVSALTMLDSIEVGNEKYLTNIEFKLDEKTMTLLILEEGLRPVSIKFDIINPRRNGVYLITIGKPDYFIIHQDWVIHHRVYYSVKGDIIIRNKYRNTLVKL